MAVLSANPTTISIVSVGLKFKGRVWRVDAPALLNRESLTWTAELINAAIPGLGTSVCNLPSNNRNCNLQIYKPCTMLRNLKRAFTSPDSVGQVESWQAEPILLRKDNLHVAYWKLCTLRALTILSSESNCWTPLVYWRSGYQVVVNHWSRLRLAALASIFTTVKFWTTAEDMA